MKTNGNQEYLDSRPIFKEVSKILCICCKCWSNFERQTIAIWCSTLSLIICPQMYKTTSWSFSYTCILAVFPQRRKASNVKQSCCQLTPQHWLLLLCLIYKHLFAMTVVQMRQELHFQLKQMINRVFAFQKDWEYLLHVVVQWQLRFNIKRSWENCQKKMKIYITE